MRGKRKKRRLHLTVTICEGRFQNHSDFFLRELYFREIADPSATLDGDVPGLKSRLLFGSISSGFLSGLVEDGLR